LAVDIKSAALVFPVLIAARLEVIHMPG